MKKGIQVLGLVVIIILTFGFVALRLLAQGSEDNFFNRHWRASFARYETLRLILGLHWDGDGRDAYLGKQYQRVLVEVDSLQGTTINTKALDLLTERIQKVLDKDISYVVSDSEIEAPPSLDKQDTTNVVERYRTYKNSFKTSTVYVLIANRDENAPDLLGTTFEEYGIVIFQEALRDFTKRSPVTITNYEESTILHEFGHQLGLPHNDQVDCLMNEHAEEQDVALQQSEDVITDFCDYEKDLIKDMQML